MGKVIRIAPIGDSITAQAGAPTSKTLGYRIHLHAKLVAAGFTPSWLGMAETTSSFFPGAVLRHTGIGGATIAEIDQTLDRARLDLIATSDGAKDLSTPDGSRPPDFALWLGGTNDLAQRKKLETAPDRSMAFVDRLRRAWPTTTIIVGLNPALAGRESERQAFNARLAKLAWTRRHNHVAIAKTQAAYSVKQTMDGTHPDDSGANGLALRFFDAIAWNRPSRALGIAAVGLAIAGAVVVLSA